MLWPLSFLVGILKLETSRVFTPLGCILALAALPRLRRHHFAAAWYVAVLLYYLVSARTSGDSWAYYDHSMVVAPGSLLMAAGLDWLLTKEGDGGTEPRRARRYGQASRLIAGLTLASLIALGIRATLNQRERWETDLLDLYVCTREFEPLVPADENIIVQGGTRFDEYRTPVGFNRPMVFAWMDHKGLSYAEEDLSLETLVRLAAAGGRYWMVHENDLRRLDTAEVSSRYSRLDECGGDYVLMGLP